jgi:hypothetical protein
MAEIALATDATRTALASAEVLSAVQPNARVRDRP